MVFTITKLAGAVIVMARTFDSSKDELILESVLNILSSYSYDQISMSMIASEAGVSKATIYRRWKSKESVVIDAIASMKKKQVDLDGLPNSGSLKRDLMSLFKPQSKKQVERKMSVLAGLASLVSLHPELSTLVNDALVEPWRKAHYEIMCNANRRNEIRFPENIELASSIIPRLAVYRSLVERKPFTKAFLEELIDKIILPTLGIGR